jgi:hypothetical protein
LNIPCSQESFVDGPLELYSKSSDYGASPEQRAVGKVAEEEEQMYPQRMVRQTLRLGLVVTLVALALGACGGGVAKDRAEEAATIKTLAGGWGTHLGDGGLAMAAGFCGSNDVALDVSGNLYISDGDLLQRTRRSHRSEAEP